MIDTQKLIDGARAYGISLTAEMAAQLDKYAELLVDWNNKINLTAITDPDGIVEKHFIDSLLLLSAYDLPQGATMIDVGTGAGFPSVPVKIARPDVKLTLLDSLNKRIKFLDALCDGIGVSAQTVHGRAEELARKTEYREQYAVATARAVAKLPVLCEYCLPYVKVGGVFVALKGSDAEEEMRISKNAVKQLGAEIADFKTFTLPDSSKRGIVVIKKISQTAARFPRQSAKIAKSPL